MSYAERIRHPSGALDPIEKGRRNFWLWVLLGIVALVVAYKAGWLDKILASGEKVVSAIPNPHGWV